jgi:hypothetical protein
MITRINARGLLAMPADGSKGRIFPQGGQTLILRMVKISAGNPAFPAAVALF